MEGNVKTCRLCGKPLSRTIFLGKRQVKFYIHENEDTGLCASKGGPAIADDQKWFQRCLIAYNKMRVKSEQLGLTYPRDKEGKPRIFGDRYNEQAL